MCSTTLFIDNIPFELPTNEAQRISICVRSTQAFLFHKFVFEEIYGNHEGIFFRGAYEIKAQTGTGKGIIARAIHSRSARKSRPMITVNCTALPANLIESELFGREKGAFTGANERQMGRFELTVRGSVVTRNSVKILQIMSKRLFDHESDK